MNEKIEELQDKLYEARSKLSQMRKALETAEEALKSCVAHRLQQLKYPYEMTFDDDLVRCALKLIASIRNEETK